MNFPLFPVLHRKSNNLAACLKDVQKGTQKPSSDICQKGSADLETAVQINIVNSKSKKESENPSKDKKKIEKSLKYMSEKIKHVDRELAKSKMCGPPSKVRISNEKMSKYHCF